MTTDPYYKLADEIKKSSDEMLTRIDPKVQDVLSEAQIYVPTVQYYGFLRILHKRNIRQMMKNTVTPIEDTAFNRYWCNKLGRLYNFLTGKTFLLYPKMSQELVNTYVQGLKDIENKVFHGFSSIPLIPVELGEQI